MRSRESTHLHSQTQCVEYDEEKHQVLKVAGGHQVPELVLERVFRDVAAEGPSFQSVLYTLALQWKDHTNQRLQELSEQKQESFFSTEKKL